MHQVGGGVPGNGSRVGRQPKRSEPLEKLRQKVGKTPPLLGHESGRSGQIAERVKIEKTENNPARNTVRGIFYKTNVECFC